MPNSTAKITILILIILTLGLASAYLYLKLYPLQPDPATTQDSASGQASSKANSCTGAAECQPYYSSSDGFIFCANSSLASKCPDCKPTNPDGSTFDIGCSCIRGTCTYSDLTSPSPEPADL